MATRFRFESGPMQFGCTMTSEDGGSAFVYCNLHGRPRFMLTGARTDTAVANAPQIDTMKQFRAFVLERFKDEPEG